MIKTEMKNWVFFLLELEEMYEQYELKRKVEKDPYIQLSLDAHMTVISNCMREYRQYIKNIWDDNGEKYKTYLNNNLLDTHNKLRKEKQTYMVVIHNEILGLYNRLSKRFTEFINE